MPTKSLMTKAFLIRSQPGYDHQTVKLPLSLITYITRPHGFWLAGKLKAACGKLYYLVAETAVQCFNAEWTKSDWRNNRARH